MIKIYVKKQSNYPVSSVKIKRTLRTLLEKSGIVSDCVVSVALVGEKKMRELGKKYLKDDELHSVLSFPFEESKEKFVYPAGAKIHLGEIIVCYPVAVQEAKKEEKLIDDKIYELVEHGAMHLMGIHHE